MKTLKLVFGILCICLCGFVIFQSCAAGIGNALADNGEVSGTAGMLVAIGLAVGGIVMLATRNKGKGGAIACIVIFAIVAIIGFANAGSYGDLYIWSGLCLAMAALNLVSLFLKPKADKEETAAK